MKKQKIILVLDRVYQEGINKHEMWYRGNDIVLDADQKKKVIDLLFHSGYTWHSNVDDSMKKEIELTLLTLEPFKVNIGAMQWFPRGKDEEWYNKYHLWSADITIAMPRTIIRKFEDPLVKDPAFIAVIGQDEREEVQFDSEFMEIDTMKSLLKLLEPEFEIEYQEETNSKNNVERQNEQRIRNIIQWTDEDAEFYKEFFSGKVGEKIGEIYDFAQTIDGDIESKMKAVREKFPEQF